MNGTAGGALLSGIRLVAFAAVLALSAACGPTVASAPAPARPTLQLATTTSTQDSGLLDVLIPDFERKTGYRVKTTAVGTGAALALGAKGDADVLLVHAPTAEEQYMKDGNGDRRLLLMHNDFVILGPPADPAGVKGRPALAAFRAIAAAGAPFISRGDNSGTDILEKALWRSTGISPAKPWYVEAGTGMGQALTIASEKGAYILTDRATYLARRAALALGIVSENDPPLINIYHVITVSPTKFPGVNKAAADAFADYLVSPATQQLIGSFGVDRYGERLFFPDAGKRESDITG